MKKTVSLMLSLVIILAVIPFGASAYGEYNDDAYETIYNGLINLSDEIDVSDHDLGIDAFKQLFTDVYDNSPELFYVSRVYRLSTNMAQTEVLTFKPTYLFSGSALESAQNEFQSMVDDIVSLLPDGLADYEKALFFHDYLCVNYEYDESYSIYEAYSMLKNGKGVCQAYSLVYDALLAEVGIESYAVYCDEQNHMWNQIKVNGKWYNVDVTWDDTMIRMSDTVSIDHFGLAQHTHFLTSDSLAIENHDCTYIRSKYACNDTTFDNLTWHTDGTPFGFADGDAYYINNGVISRIDILTNKATAVYTVDAEWSLPDGSYYPDKVYSGFGSYGNKLIFNTDKKIMYFDPADSSVGVAYDPQLGDENIYKMYVSGNTVHYMYSVEHSYQGETAQHTLNFSTDTPAPAPTPTPDPEPVPEPDDTTPYYGNVNLSAKVDISDYILIKRSILQTYTFNDEQVLRADINGVGGVNIADCILCKRIILKTYTPAK